MPIVFISHISEEARIASTLKKHIEAALAGQVKVFVSSDPRDLPAGTKWLERISQAIESAEVLVVLCSPVALKRPWINFEMGCGWEKKVPIIPVCHSGQKKGELPAPISEFQALEMDSETFVANFFHALTQHLKIQGVPKIDQNPMKGELMAALQLEPVAVPEVAVAEVGPAPAPQEELDDESRGILKAMADMGDEGFAAEDLAGNFGMSRPKMEHYLEKLARGGHVTYQQEIVDDPPVARLEEKGRTYLFERNLL